jgi:PAP2 superfamily
MPLLDMNMDMNMNMAFETVSAGRVVRPRFNSDVAARLVDTAQDLVPAAGNYGFYETNTSPPVGTIDTYPPYPLYWDAELHASMYFDAFLTSVVNKYTIAPDDNWRKAYSRVARTAGKPPSEMIQSELNQQVLEMLDLALEREPRFAEILDQDDSVGSLSYWLGMLKIDPARTPNAYLLVRVGRRVGEHVSMCLKGDFRAPRPSQVSPAITPMIDPPITPSFPAGHAIQAYLISFLLADAMHEFPQQIAPAHGSNEAQWLAATGLLFDLAARVSENRVVAGLHYPVDIDAGRVVAARTFVDLQAVPEMQALRTAVIGEFPQYQ